MIENTGTPEQRGQILRALYDAHKHQLYDAEFFAEINVDYPLINEFESSLGFALPRYQLEHAARRLACPLKKHPVCWQHGRVVYAMVRRILAGWDETHIPADPLFLDIGTAKGFSALMMQFAIRDSGMPISYFDVISLDVIDPAARVARNTVAEIDGLLTLEEILAPWREDASNITFIKSDSVNWLDLQGRRIHFAFIDGKHSYQAVSNELAHLARLQRSGDALVLDDMQIDGVRQALDEYRHAYTFQILEAKPVNETNGREHAARSYAVAIRR
jgi:predicted O-methyltransferase YrrM